MARSSFTQSAQSGDQPLSSTIALVWLKTRGDGMVVVDHSNLDAVSRLKKVFSNASSAQKYIGKMVKRQHGIDAERILFNPEIPMDRNAAIH